MKKYATSALFAGSSVIDRPLRPESVSLVPTYVQTNGPDSAIAYRGSQTAAWGEKRDTFQPLGPVASALGLDEIPGGGAFRTSDAFSRHSDVPFTLIDGVNSPAVAAEIAKRGGQYVPVSDSRAPDNIAVVNPPDGQRIILRSQFAQPASDPTRAPGFADAGSDWLVLNSVKDRQFAAHLSDRALAAGARQVSVLNGALPMADQTTLLLGRDCLSVANLGEFAAVANTLGIFCPTDEKTALVDEVASALAAVAGSTVTGHLAVTMGARGAIGFHRGDSMAFHVQMPSMQQSEIAWRARNRPDGVNGAGDEWLGRLLAALVGVVPPASPISPGTFLQAMTQACLGVALWLCPGLKTGRNPVECSIFPDVIPAPVSITFPIPPHGGNGAAPGLSAA